jgi:hypothetical protein
MRNLPGHRIDEAVRSPAMTHDDLNAILAAACLALATIIVIIWVTK